MKNSFRFCFISLFYRLIHFACQVCAKIVIPKTLEIMQCLFHRLFMLGLVVLMFCFFLFLLVIKCDAWFSMRRISDIWCFVTVVISIVCFVVIYPFSTLLFVLTHCFLVVISLYLSLHVSLSVFVLFCFAFFFLSSVLFLKLQTLICFQNIKMSMLSHKFNATRKE